MAKYFIIGGAGFIGSHLARLLVSDGKDDSIIIYDNFSSGRLCHLDVVLDNGNVRLIRGDAKDRDKLIDAMPGADIVCHFASNPDISKAVTQPDIDFWEGTYLTNNILEAMRLNNVKKLLYASGSGVYGDTGFLEVAEDYSPMLPISAYGASKLACEALICSYCHMFDINAAAFRFANVVGPHQTHGVGYDFIKKLMSNNKQLTILGNGTQSKSYIFVSDVLSAMRLVESKNLKGFSYFNVATLDCLTVSEIADIVIEAMGLKDVKCLYTGGNRGWKGDVPIIRLNSQKIRKHGWENRYTSKEAMAASVKSMFEDANV